VDALLGAPDVAPLLDAHPRPLVVRALRAALAAARAAGGDAPGQGWGAAAARHLASTTAPSLVPVVNATGVVLHTNLGRAPLAARAVAAIQGAATGYTALEYDLGRGVRGSRNLHGRDLLVELTGAEDALVVNNAAAALLLALSALARDGEAVVSRGELVEIGGAFRIPDILARSGAALVEVGTTNRTHADDYRQAIRPATRLLLKVHRSNFQVTGFTAEVPASGVAELARAAGVASLYDVGSGLLLDLTPWGLGGEPLVRDAVAAGGDLVVFSGDKLLGGPQAGILVGRAAAIAACRADPVARAVRADKLTLAALEATLALYRDPDTARREIPVLRMLTLDSSALRAQAERLCDALPPAAAARLTDGTTEVGGGSFPGVTLPAVLVVLRPAAPGPDELLRRLRDAPTSVIARIADGNVVLDPRTLLPGDADHVVRAVAGALDG
jgi:L-seryl-tRNA(Ser) seleniumtransferase